MGGKRIESLIKEQASGWNAGKDETQVEECRKEMHMQKKRGYIVHDAAMNVYRSSQNWSKGKCEVEGAGGIVNDRRSCYVGS